MTVLAGAHRPSADAVTLTLRGHRRDHVARFHAPATDLEVSGDALLSFGLLPAMRLGEDLRVPDPVSPRLLAGAERIQVIVNTWDERLLRIRIDTRVAAYRPPKTDRRSAAFFSGGVDSFYTALKHHSTIDALVFVAGFDASLADRSILIEARRAVRAAADELGKELVEVQTDIRDVQDPVDGWRLAHGAALATIGHLLRGAFDTFYIPSSLSPDVLRPWGSHPDLDRWWSSDGVAFHHDGFEADRFTKVATIARHPTAMRWLRVCNIPGRTASNCGTCQKCLCTKVALTISGHGEMCETLPGPLDIASVASLRLTSEEYRPIWAQNLREASMRDDQHDLRDLLAILLDPR